MLWEWSDYKMKWDMYEMNMIIECRWEWNEYEVEKKKDEWVDRIRWLYWVKKKEWNNCNKSDKNEECNDDWWELL